MKDYKCPICEKAGLEDYRKKEITCPTCNSNLSVFKALNQYTTNNNNFYKYAIIGCLLCVSVVLLLLTFSSGNTQKRLNAKLIENAQTIEQLNDSIVQIKKTKSLVATKIIENFYTVREGDSFCLISFRLFGSEKYAKEIAKLNGKSVDNLIFPGSKFIIPQN